jgi:hypothetical protein
MTAKGTLLFSLSQREYKGVGLTTPPWKRVLSRNLKEAIAGYFSWQKLLRRARAHVGLSSQR